jgi:hypothetical protein
MSLQGLKRMASAALLIGGLLWIIVFTIFVSIGAATGKFPDPPGPHSSPGVFIGSAIFLLSILILDLGQIGMVARMQGQGRARALRIISLVFTLLSAVLIIINVVLFIFGSITGSAGYSGTLTGLGAMTLSISAAFLGWAGLRTKVLARGAAWTLIGIGITTIPILFSTPLPIGPDWATDMLAFLTSGIAYAVVGAITLKMRQKQGEMVDMTTNQPFVEVK